MSTEVQVNAFQERLAALEREIAQMSLSEIGGDEYYRQFLEKSVSVVGVGGAVWTVNEADLVVRHCHMNLEMAGLDEGGSQVAMLNSVLQRLIQTKAPIVLPAKAGSDMYDGGMGDAAVNQSAHALLFVPIFLMNELSAVVLIISPEEVDPRAVRGFLGYLVGLCEQASRFFERLRVKELQGQINQRERYRQYISSVHSGLDPKKACYALANYAQEILGVYRCMAGTFSSKGKFRMESVSGVESVAVKSEFIQTISSICQEVCKNDKVLLVDNPNEAVSKVQKDAGDELLMASRLYMLQAETVMMGIFPIKYDGVVVGALVIEKALEIPFEQAERRKIEGLLVEAGSAISNGMKYRYLPLALAMRSLGKMRDKLYRMGHIKRSVVITVLLMVIVLPLIIQKQVKVIGTAELVPISSRIAYSQQEGVIETVDIPADYRVEAGQGLASLDRRIIESEIDQVSNSINEARVAFLDAQGSGLIAQAGQLELKIKALEAEYKKLNLQRDEYEIKAPVAGTIITRESDIRLLASKPVKRGDPILEIVPDESNWDLMVNIPEDQAGELLKAYDNNESGEPLKARIILNAYPDEIFDTEVVSVASRAVVESSGEQKYRNVIEVHVKEPVGLREHISPRQGMEGKVAIECGPRCLWYVVTHEFVDFMRVSLF